MAEKKFVNILDDVKAPKEESESSVESTSGILENDKHGICPKCGASMGQALLANGEAVYYCKPCRVSSPVEMLDEE